MDFETGSGFAILVSTDLKYGLCDRTQSERSGDLTAYLANKTLLRLTKQFETMKLKGIILKKKKHLATGWSISYRKYILQITQPSQYRYSKLQYRFAVTSWSPSMHGKSEKRSFFFITDAVQKIY